MADLVVVELNREGVRQLLRSKEMQAELQKHADAALSRLGEGYESDAFVGPNRANVSITAASFDAIRENRDENTVLKALM